MTPYLSPKPIDTTANTVVYDSTANSIPPAYEHQKQTTEFLIDKEAAFITSSPGTGKTRSVIDAIKTRTGRSLILAPKSILVPSWAEDIKKFAPELTYAVATAENRQSAFEMGTKVVITNVDAAVWLEKNKAVLEEFETLVLDESTAFKNPNSQRSKAVEKIAQLFKYRIGLTGTPNPNGIIDLFQQIKILDQGQRLGNSYWKYRAATHEPEARGQFTTWKEKDGINNVVYGLIQDINLRFKLEDCIDMPDQITTPINFELSTKHLRFYKTLQKNMVAQLQNGTITALNRASLAIKLIQAASGAVYDDNHEYQLVDKGRYELIIDLIQAREQCVVAFLWEHQKKILCEMADFPYGIIDGSTPMEKRTKTVEDFQAGKIKVIFAHPQSASHGLTLTAGTTTIWASPTHNAEHFTQFNNRIYRAGQTKKTETILIAAQQTIDERVYQNLISKNEKMSDLLELLEI